LTTVISKQHRELATVDAGIKAFATDRDCEPEIKGMTGIAYQLAGDEHGFLNLNSPSRDIRLGDRLELLVPHCDPTVNLYDQLFCRRDGMIEDVWVIAGRGHQ